MKAVDLGRRVQFLRAALVDDGYQTHQGPYAPHGSPVQASGYVISDRERYAADTVGVAAEVRFTVRRSSFTGGLRHTDRLVCDGRTYAIAGIKEIKHRVWIEITAAEVRG